MKKLTTTPTHDRKSQGHYRCVLSLCLITALFLYATPFRPEALGLISYLHSENSPHNALTLGGIL
jgi:hypothetical protein